MTQTKFDFRPQQNLAFNSKQILKNSILDLQKNSNSLIVKIGCELEFFLFGDYDKVFIEKLKAVIVKNFDLVYDLKSEQGEGQYEINIREVDNINYLALIISQIRDFVIKYCGDHHVIADFQAKPINDDCGNSMQFNISIHEADKNLFSELNNKIYKNLIASLLTYSNEILFLSCVKKEEFLRFNLDNNVALFKNKKYVAPTNYSYGVDNRTCLVRCLKNRLEYRLASASCDVYLIMSAIVFCINKSLVCEIKLDQERVYGNSFDEIYNMKLLEGYDESKEIFFNGVIYDYFKNIHRHC